MSNPSPPQGNRGLANLERTRQQLQELDSLLQQMLALPMAEQSPEAEVGAADEQPEVVADSANDESAPKRLLTLSVQKGGGTAGPGAKRALPIHVAPAPVVETPQVEVAAVPSPLPPIPPVRPGKADFDPAKLDLTGPSAYDVSRDVELGFDAVTPPSWDLGASTSTVKRPFAYRTLVGINASFDWSLRWLGPQGSERARTYLGWIGLLSLLGAAALGVGMLLGWTW
jgi:hypothetical protein